MKIIAFGHRSRMGKNTCAYLFKQFAQDAGWLSEVTSFAKDLKAACYIMFKGFGMMDEQYYEEHPEMRDIKLKDINMTPVEIWVKVGTPLIREQMHDDTWIRSTLYDRPGVKYLIISDLRFPNEYNAIQKTGGICIKVHNPRIPYRNSVADEALERFTAWDYFINNNSDIVDLKIKVKEIYESQRK